MPTTSQIRDWWAPACEGPFIRLALHGKGTVSVDPAVSDAVLALSACLEVHKYATRAEDTGAYNCRPITGGTDYSLHAYGVAVDINWATNPYGDELVTDMPAPMVAAIKAIRTQNGKPVWRWGGDYAGNKDAMHFECIAHPADLMTGIDPFSLPQPPQPPQQEDEMSPYKIVWIKGAGKPGKSYRVLYGAGKDGKPFPVEAHVVNSTDLDEWRKRLDEVPSDKPLPPSPFIRILDGPYKNVA